jgi:hypothetical protein
LGANGSFRRGRRPRRAVAALGVLLLAVTTASLVGSHAAQAVTAPKALILSDSVSVPGPAPASLTQSLEEYEAIADGFSVTTVTGTQWDAMTANQFAAYQVLIIGDKTCSDATEFAAAATNASTWEPVVMKSGGNKVIIGTDPVYHDEPGHHGPNAWRLIKNGIAYAGQVASATGAYVDLSCAYESNTDAPGTAVPLLDGLSSHGTGQFTVVGEGFFTDACATTVNIVAQTGPTAGLVDDDLSSWGCSVHEAFTTFPSDYTPLALAPASSGFPQSYCADDVTVKPLSQVCGAPYILVSGAGVTVTSQLSLTPATQSLIVGGKATVTAKLAASGAGKRPAVPSIASFPIVFNVDSGPNAGVTFSTTIGAIGTAAFSYNDTGGVGIDHISATVTSGGVSQKATATVTWAKAKTTLTTSLSGGGKSGTSISVPVNTPVTDTATLAGAKNGAATGLVDFSVYKDAACTKLYGVTEKAVSAGKITTPAIALPVGTYYWVAVYGGDNNNQSATAKCGSEVLTVLPVSVDTKVTVLGESKVTAKVSTTTPGDLIVAYVFGDAGTGAKANEFATVSGGGLTWKLVARSNAERSDAEVWVARASGRLQNAAVTITGKFTGFDEGATIVAYKNAVGIGAAVAAHAAKGAPTATLKTLGFDTYVYGVGVDWGHYILRTPGAGQVILSQPTDKDADKETFWVQMVTKVVPNSATSVTLNDTKPTADHYDMVVVDIS